MRLLFKKYYYISFIWIVILHIILIFLFFIINNHEQKTSVEQSDPIISITYDEQNTEKAQLIAGSTAGKADRNGLSICTTEQKIDSKPIEEIDHTDLIEQNETKNERQAQSESELISEYKDNASESDQHTITVTSEKKDQPITGHVHDTKIVKKRSIRKLNTKKTVANMTHEALNFLKITKGNGHINEQGNQHKNPSDLQMLRERYWQQVETIWQQAYQSMTQQYNVSSENTHITKVILVFHENGCLKHISLAQTSADTQEIDQAVIESFLAAANQFPPIPERLKKHDGLTRLCTVYVYPHHAFWSR